MSLSKKVLFELVSCTLGLPRDTLGSLSMNCISLHRLVNRIWSIHCEMASSIIKWITLHVAHIAVAPVFDAARHIFALRVEDLGHLFVQSLKKGAYRKDTFNSSTSMAKNWPDLLPQTPMSMDRKSIIDIFNEAGVVLDTNDIII